MHTTPISQDGATGTATPTRPRGRGWLPALLVRLHFYAGILIGPFIIIAATSGALYALTPSLERVVYAHELTAPATTEPLSLAAQIRAAEAYAGPNATLTAVRPAPEPGATTRVLFTEPGLGDSESRAVFVDPGTAEIRGDLSSYGTSGALPLRIWVDHLHRDLHLGETGRLYSELAASWLGIVAAAGIALWIIRVRKARAKRDFVRPNLHATGYRRSLSWHTSLGIWVAVGALFLSATGITWSQHAGDNIGALRSTLSWGTPRVNTALDAAAPAGGEHSHHHGGAVAPTQAADPEQFDAVLALAQQVNVDTGHVEIVPPTDANTAWFVREIKASFPTQVDQLAINGDTMEVVDRVDFADYSLPAKFSRWGIDLHMGVMFGLANQIVLFVIAIGIISLVVFGYRMWWQRRPTRTSPLQFGKAPTRGALRGAPWWGVATVAAIAIALGMFLPLVGWTLLGFVVIDVVVGAVQQRRARSGRAADTR